MASKNTKQSYFDQKKKKEHEEALKRLDLYSVFLKGTSNLAYPGSTGVTKEEAERLSRGLVADTEIRLVRPGIKD